LTYSNTFSNSDWGTGGYGNIANVVSNDIISPDGLMNGSKITFSAGSTQSRLIQQVSVVNGGIYEASVYVKYGNKTNVSLYCDTAIIGLNATFNFTTKTLTAYGVTNPIVTELSDGWFRLQFTYTAPSSTSQIGFISNIGEDGFVYLYGAQCEQGSYATSYIPTTSASVTRNADVISKTGISSLLNPSEGTLFVEAAELKDNASKMFQITNGTDLNTVSVEFNNNTLRVGIVGGGGGYRKSDIPTNLYGFNKIAIGWISGNISCFVNGVQYTMTLYTGSGDGIPTQLDRITFSYWWNGGPFYANTKTIAIWKTRLTNDTLATLTTI
jgi:hypothetical protein